MMRIIWAALALWLLPPAQAAVQVTDRFSADIVPAQITQSLARSQRQALAQVLVKLTGNSAVLTDPLVDKALARADGYVVQYNYYQSDGQERFRAVFNASQVETLLTQAELPIWGSLRPQLLFWIAQEQPTSRRLLGDGDTGALVDTLKRTASARGLPALVPLMDLDDAMAVSSADVWGRFIGNLQPASRRYDADFIVVAKVIPQPSLGWQLSWQLWSREMAGTGVLARGQASGSEAEIARTMISQIADHLGTTYAMRGDHSAQGAQRLIVNGVDRVADLVALKRMLRQIPAVASSRLSRVDGEQLMFELTLLGSVGEFEQALALEQRLQAVEVPASFTAPAAPSVAAPEAAAPVSGSPAAADAEVTGRQLVYRWQSTG